MKVVRLSPLRTYHVYPQEVFLVLISVRRWLDPKAIVWPEGLCQWKITVTPSGIAPWMGRTVRLLINLIIEEWCWEAQEGGINRKHWLNWRMSSTYSYRQMYVSNPQYKGTDIREQVWNVMWIKDYVWNWSVEIEWGTERIRWGSSLILREINGYTELCNEWVGWDGTW